VKVGPQWWMPLKFLSPSYPLAQRGPAGVELDEEPHERAVHRLLDRINGEQAMGGLYRSFEIRALSLEGQELGQCPDPQLLQPQAFGHEPGLEWRLEKREALEERAAIEPGGSLQTLARALAREMLEARHVDLDGPGPEGDGSACLLEQVIRGSALRIAKIA
jgi:hypothetical protein